MNNKIDLWEMLKFLSEEKLELKKEMREMGNNLIYAYNTSKNWTKTMIHDQLCNYGDRYNSCKIKLSQLQYLNIHY